MRLNFVQCKNSLTSFQMARVFLLTFFVIIMIIGSSLPAGADTYGISTNDPAVTSNGTISATDPNETRGINYFGTGTIFNYGNITTVTAGGAGNSYGVYSVPSARLIYNGGNITSTADANDATVYAIYVLNGFNTVSNDGRITANATGNATAVSGGINTLSSVVTNNGTISASSSAPNFISYGINNFNGVVINSGTVSVTGIGISGAAIGVLTPFGTLNNSGTISATGSGSGLVLVESLNYGNGSVTNSGTIEARSSSSGAAAIAYGIYDGAGGGGYLVNNSGNITVSAIGSGIGTAAQAFGIETNDTVINSGNISATANGFNCSVAGIFSDFSGVINIGNITVSAHDGFNNFAYGISSMGNVTNYGNISVTADTTRSGISASYAFGIDADDPVGVINGGRITVHAQGLTAYALGISSTANAVVNNSGEITVSADGSDSHAYGVYFNNGGTLTNTGVIRAGGDNAYEVYVNAGTVNLVNRYNMTLDGNPAKGSIFLNAGSTINLNNSLFSVTAVPVHFNTQYRIFEGTGTVNGAFGSIVQPQNPAVSLLYHNQGTAGSIDDAVSLSYHPNASPALEGVNIGRFLLTTFLDPVRQYQINGFLEGMISGKPVQVAVNDTVASDAPVNLIPSAANENVYFIPYYGGLNNSSGTLGYNARLYGLTVGYDKRLGYHQLGFHLGIGRAEADFNGTEFPFNTKEHQNIISLGLQGLSHWGNWILRGDLTGFYGYNDYSALSGLNFDALETANYNSCGTTENLMTGYTIKVGSNVIYPEIGLNHVWIRQDSFNTSASFGGWQTDVSSVNDNLFQALGNIRWLNRFSLQSLSFTTSAAVGGRYRINNGNLTIDQTVPGSSPVTIAADQERKAATASLSLAVMKNNFSAELAYNGDYSSDITRHTGWLKLAYAF